MPAIEACSCRTGRRSVHCWSWDHLGHKSNFLESDLCWVVRLQKRRTQSKNQEPWLGQWDAEKKRLKSCVEVEAGDFCFIFDLMGMSAQNCGRPWKITVWTQYGPFLLFLRRIFLKNRMDFEVIHWPGVHCTLHTFITTALKIIKRFCPPASLDGSMKYKISRLKFLSDFLARQYSGTSYQGEICEWAGERLTGILYIDGGSSYTWGVAAASWRYLHKARHYHMKHPKICNDFDRPCTTESHGSMSVAVQSCFDISAQTSQQVL